MNKFQERRLQTALDYADRGWRVLPVWIPKDGSTKRPFINDWTNAASIDKDTIKGWWEQWNNANIGILTGADSGIWVIDVDIKDGKNGLETLTEHFGSKFDWDTKRWLTGKTPTGGIHFIVRWNPEHPVKSKSAVLEGIDTRGHGGQIVVAPSSRLIDDEWEEYRWNDPDYEICPFDQYEWVQEIAALADQRSPSTTIFDVERVVRGIPQGERDESLNRYAWHLKGRGIDMGLAIGFIEAACERAKPPFDKIKAREMIERAYATVDTVPSKDEHIEAMRKLRQGR